MSKWCLAKSAERKVELERSPFTIRMSDKKGTLVVPLE